MNSYAPFRSPDYRFLLAGTFLSSFGLQMVSVAASWDLYVATHSAVVLGNVGFVQVAPFIAFALFAGHFADRHDKRKILIVTQFVLLVSAVLLVFVSRSVPVIYLCLFLTASGRAFQAPARQSLLPRVIGPDAVGRAITWNSSAQEIATVSGPGLAGLLLATVGSHAAYVVQLVCVLAALTCFSLIRYRSIALDEMAAPETTIRSLLDGLRFVFGSGLVLSAISLDLFAVLFGGATALLPIYAVEILHIGVQGLGWLRAAPSIGAAGMALVQAHIPRVRSAGRVVLWSVAGFGAATAIFGLSRSVVLSFAMLVLIGAFDNISVVLRQSLVQSATPSPLLGRVSAVNSVFVSCSNQLGAVESGWTAGLFGAIPSVVGGGFATLLVVAAYAAKARSLRNWETL